MWTEKERDEMRGGEAKKQPHLLAVLHRVWLIARHSSETAPAVLFVVHGCGRGCPLLLPRSRLGLSLSLATLALISASLCR